MTYDKSFSDKKNDLFGSESYIVGKRIQRFFNMLYQLKYTAIFKLEFYINKDFVIKWMEWRIFYG